MDFKAIGEYVDITVYALTESQLHHCVTENFVLPEMTGVKVVWYSGFRMRMLKDGLSFRLFDCLVYDKVNTTSHGFILNSFALRNVRKLLVGIQVQSTFDERPVENKV